MKPVLLIVLIVNWNSKEFVRNCIKSIRSTCQDLDPQIVVVDGGSFDGCGDMVKQEFPEVEFVKALRTSVSDARTILGSGALGERLCYC